MLKFLAQKEDKSAIPLTVVTQKSFTVWNKQDAFRARWVSANHFTCEPGSFLPVPSPKGDLASVIVGISEKPDMWSLGHLPAQLPPGTYRLEGKFSAHEATQLVLGWALAAYQFTAYKKSAKKFARLALPANADADYVYRMAETIHWIRDMINAPANVMNPTGLSCECTQFAASHKLKSHVLVGDDLLKHNWPTVHAVGRASADAPRVVDLRWGKPGAPKLTLVGKGVCFDSGGLDIKGADNMKLMKKDMAGAACVLGLARMIVESGLKVNLRVLLPIVENAVSGNAMRPLDVVRTRKGLTVEIGNTDAEGRLILCDALYEADQENPDLIIDCSTLTGAARVALGTDVPAFFTHDDKLAKDLMKHSAEQQDPLWRLPLWSGYRGQIDSSVADLNNDPDSRYGGAITAALYLNEFVSSSTPWVHIDMMAWNQAARPGRPKGGEAMAVRALFSLLEERYGRN